MQELWTNPAFQKCFTLALFAAIVILAIGFQPKYTPRAAYSAADGANGENTGVDQGEGEKARQRAKNEVKTPGGYEFTFIYNGLNMIQSVNIREPKKPIVYYRLDTPLKDTDVNREIAMSRAVSYYLVENDKRKKAKGLTLEVSREGRLTTSDMGNLVGGKSSDSKAVVPGSPIERII